ncbi:hypothetical protein EHI47_07390 [Rhizobium leguminosarum]|uniref:Uncharacterized protein n=1 Tax=Rhizobium leguminosarum TaxID=384 RepID=A0A444I7W1_RHILE|nr:hypothetical protein [Rhizobium leguminosarum]RWX34213.1 hypothetical protein EHI47_07390 [Rhizobium leguminosarum]
MVSRDSRPQRVDLRIVAIDGRVIVERLDMLSEKNAYADHPRCVQSEKRKSFLRRLIEDFAFACELYSPYQLFSERADLEIDREPSEIAPHLRECQIADLKFPPVI